MAHGLLDLGSWRHNVVSWNGGSRMGSLILELDEISYDFPD